MSTHFAKPENALRKAADFVRVNKPSSALKTLSNILASKRFRAWTQTHEKILFLYLELSVDLRRPAKDGLIQYRSIAQAANSNSLEKVMRYYRQLAVARTEKAHAEAVAAGVADAELHSRAAAEADDEDDAGDGSALLMAAQFGEGAKERKDRQILLPWVRYQWDAYRTIIDVCRNNVKLERLYHEMARAAFEYCVHFEQKAQFKKLAELMRSHLYFANKYIGQANSLDLSNPETQSMYLETRFLALEAASKLELWQEAYRVIEDIYEAMKSAQAEPNATLMKTYFEKLSEIFWASHNFLFHAYSLDKFFTLSFQDVDASSLDESVRAERQKLANMLVLASLIVSGQQNEDELLIQRHEGAARLAQLLGFKRETPSRGRLMNLIHSQGVLREASPAVVAVYDLLENRVSPLTLWSQLQPFFTQIEADTPLAKYIEPLHRLTVVRVLQQLSSFFSTIRISAFLRLIPTGANSSISASKELTKTDAVKALVPFERLILSSISSEHVALRIDHAKGLLIFPADDFESLRMRDQLVQLSRSLSTLANEIEPIDPRKKRQEREHVFSLIAAGVGSEHSSVQERQQEIEKRKQEQERLLVEREKRETDQKAEEIRTRKAEEARRLDEESKKREAERLKKEAEERDLLAKQQLANEITKKVESKVSKGLAKNAAKKMKELTADLEKIDRAALLAAQEAVLEQERKEVERRRRETARRLDYLTRATRLEERETLLATAEKKREDDKVQLEIDFARYVEDHRMLHEKAIAERERLKKMASQKEVFFGRLLERRTEQYQEERAKQMERFRQRQIQHEREERRRQEELAARQRAEQVLRDQEAARLAAEAAKQAAEAEKRRIREEEFARRQAEVEARQKREAEYEAKDRERLERLKPTRDDRESSFRRSDAPPRDEREFRRGDAPPRDEREFRRADAPPVRAAAGADEWRTARAGPRDEPQPRRDEPRAGWRENSRPEQPERAAGEDSRWRRNNATEQPAADVEATPEQQPAENERFPAPQKQNRFGPRDDAPPRSERFGGPRNDDAPRSDRFPRDNRDGDRSQQQPREGGERFGAPREGGNDRFRNERSERSENPRFNRGSEEPRRENDEARREFRRPAADNNAERAAPANDRWKK